MPERTQTNPPTITPPTNPYTDAAQTAHEQHCDRCHTLTTSITAFHTANATSTARRDRKQLALLLDAHPATRTAKEEARRV
ncbi:hypothetical protein [Streptomyces sp. CC208A]|uniref:hypothetical protein n=1 Tax=Streptomyces sp. CC208A TaxID=3044573 RepID=UPI0024A9BF67|nr:hypothetical protein [Streptomyces sp. CC208A]